MNQTSGEGDPTHNVDLCRDGGAVATYQIRTSRHDYDIHHAMTGIFPRKE